SLASAVAGIIFDLPMHCEFREVMSADYSLPKSVSQRRLSLFSRSDFRTAVGRLVWLWFRSPHFGLAARMMRTSEPPHYATCLSQNFGSPTRSPPWDSARTSPAIESRL